jgi:hypothetical protein
MLSMLMMMELAMVLNDVSAWFAKEWHLYADVASCC